MTTFKTGGDIDAYCSKCRLELAHIIVAMISNEVKRVQCKTCQSEHAYKAKATAKSPTASSSRERSTKNTRKIGGAGVGIGATRYQYDELIKGHNISGAPKYRPAKTFKEGEFINHPTFGLGIVTRILSDSKIEVLFPACSKVLVHARG
ncbi:MAG: hypothetical protein JW841_02720 [Deltaproteobacteria bacterium]|nr:hypothetical protein [Deltaproteobacteria bacterium]